MNNIVLTGRFTKDPEAGKTQNANYARFNLACKSRKPDHTDFFPCIAWNKKADVICKYCEKGKQVMIFGEMQSRKWEKDDGTTVTVWECVVNDIEFVGSRDDNSKTDQDRGEMIPVDDDNLPF